jgi:hypothetical protein
MERVYSGNMEDSTMFETENKYYEEHRGELRKNYLDKYLVISKDRLVGVYDTSIIAFKEAIGQFKPGDFMIKFVPANPDYEVAKFITVTPVTYA